VFIDGDYTTIWKEVIVVCLRFIPAFAMFALQHAMTAKVGAQVEHFSFSVTLALERSEWKKQRPGCLTFKMNSVPTAQEAGWAPGQSGIGAENFSPTGVRTPNRPACSESLYRLRYPDPAFAWWNDENPRKICKDFQYSTSVLNGVPSE